jgi:hypothetical protein
MKGKAGRERELKNQGICCGGAGGFLTHLGRTLNCLGKKMSTSAKPWSLTLVLYIFRADDNPS